MLQNMEASSMACIIMPSMLLCPRSTVFLTNKLTSKCCSVGCVPFGMLVLCVICDTHIAILRKYNALSITNVPVGITKLGTPEFSFFI